MTALPGGPPPWSLVSVDVDGTLTTVHGWQVIAGRLGRRREFERTQRRFLAREIGEDEHLEDMLRLAEGRRIEEVEAALDATPHLREIAAGVRLLHDQGSRVALLTHNPPYICAWYARRFGFDDFDGTGAQPVVDGVIGRPSAVRADKPAGLARLAARAGTSWDRVVHVGDGWADAALFPRVGRGIALNSRLPEVDRAADLALHTSSFRAVARRIGSLGPRT